MGCRLLPVAPANVALRLAEDSMPELPPDLNYGFNGLVGFKFEEITVDRVTASLDVETSHQQPYGIVHGGVYCTLIEAVASTGGAYWALEQGLAGAVGISNTTDFFRSVRDGRLLVEGTPIHRGRSQQLWQAVITRDGKQVARGQVRLHNLTDPEAVGGLTPD